MKKRILFIFVYIVLFPLFIVAAFVAVLHYPIGLIVWLITGDETKAFDTILGGVQGWIVSLPYKILDE